MPVQQRAFETQKKILDSAVKLFARCGLNGVSVDEIAAAAGVNKQRIYAYYGSKNALFEQCLVAVFQAVNALEDEFSGVFAAAPADMTSILLSHYIKIHRQAPEFWRLIAWANLESFSALERLSGIKDRNLTRLRGIYERGQRTGCFKSTVSFDTYIFHIFAVSYFYHSNRITLSNTLSPELFGDVGLEKFLKESAELMK